MIPLPILKITVASAEREVGPASDKKATSSSAREVGPDNTAMDFKILVEGLPALVSLPIPEMVAGPGSTKSGMATAALSAVRALGIVAGARGLEGATSSGS